MDLGTESARYYASNIRHFGEMVLQTKLKTLRKSMRNASMNTEGWHIRRFAYDWMRKHGEVRNIAAFVKYVLIFNNEPMRIRFFGDNKFARTDRQRHLFYGMAPPCDYHISLTPCSLSSTLDTLKGRLALTHDWVQLLLIDVHHCAVDRCIMLDLALTGDRRMADVFAILDRQKRISREDYADALKLLAAMILLVHADRPTCLRLWSQSSDMCASFRDLQLLETPDVDDLILQAFVVLAGVERKYLAYPRRAKVFDAKTFKEAAQMVIMSLQLASDQNRHQVLRRLHFIFRRGQARGPRNVMSTQLLRDTIDALGDDPPLRDVLQFSRNLYDSMLIFEWSQLDRGCLIKLLAKIDLAELAKATPTNDCFSTLLFLFMTQWDSDTSADLDDSSDLDDSADLDDSVDERFILLIDAGIDERFIPLLLTNGACLSGCYSQHEYIIQTAHNFRDTRTANLVLDLTCSCYPPGGRFLVFHLRCLAAAAVPEGDPEMKAQISVAKGRVRLLLSQFIDHHRYTQRIIRESIRQYIALTRR